MRATTASRVRSASESAVGISPIPTASVLRIVRYTNVGRYTVFRLQASLFCVNVLSFVRSRDTLPRRLNGLMYSHIVTGSSGSIAATSPQQATRRHKHLNERPTSDVKDRFVAPLKVNAEPIDGLLRLASRDQRLAPFDRNELKRRIDRRLVDGGCLTMLNAKSRVRR